MKIKIFNKKINHVEQMEEDVNEFIKDKKVIDIRFGTEGEYPSSNFLVVLYEERKK